MGGRIHERGGDAQFANRSVRGRRACRDRLVPPSPMENAFFVLSTQADTVQGQNENDCGRAMTVRKMKKTPVCFHQRPPPRFRVESTSGVTPNW
jgi:hypothetical protein